ncbi:unnamed protein product [Musa hybrid cultivar]
MMAAKAQAVGRYVTEAAPPQFVSIVRYKVTRILDTITEEDRDAAEAQPPSAASSPSTCRARRLRCVAWPWRDQMKPTSSS